MSFEDLFTSAELDCIVPESGITLPPGPDADEWLENLSNIDRKEAFFDEHLQTLFILRVPQPEPIPTEPPHILLEFLAHLQVLLEASYISPNDSSATDYTMSPSPLPSGRFNVPNSPAPRTSSIKKPSHLNLSLSANPRHPSILPPATPNPTPASAAIDQRYLQAEGVVLTSRIWGQDVGGNGIVDKKQADQQEGTEGFYLLWSKREEVWVAVYRSILDIAFLRLHFDSPLLCLTLSATLREKPLAIRSSSNPLAAYLSSIGGLSAPASPTAPSSPVNAQEERVIDDNSQVGGGPPEINLLAGLFAGPTFAPASSLGSPKAKTPQSQATDTAAASTDIDLTLSSTRLGPLSRAKLFALPPIEPETPTSSALMTPTPVPGQSALPNTGGHFRQPTMGGRGKAVLKKSFRKILETTSGFKVRMRTVFVPAVLLDEGAEDFDDVELGDGGRSAAEAEEDSEGDDDQDDEDPDRLTSGASERTVVLCVEIETEGDPLYRAAEAPDFVVEKVDISITGGAGGGDDGATARLIGWDTADTIARKGRRKSKKQFPKSAEKASFPLYLSPHEQHNLLRKYWMDLGSALNPSNLTTGVGMNALPSAGVLGPNGGVKQSGPDKSLQRAVTINIFGKPCYAEKKSAIEIQDKAYHYPTDTFSSRWNCVLDLSLSQQIPRRDFSQEYGDETPLPTINALPEPPSPFPVPVSFAASPRFPSIPASASYPSIASVVSPRDRSSLGFGLDLGPNSGDRRASLAAFSTSGPATTSMTDKRHTLPTLPRVLPPYIQSAGPGPMERPSSALGQSRERKDSLGLLGGRQRRDSLPVPSPTSSRYTPPSVTLTASTQQPLRSPTTYEAPPPPPFKDFGDRGGNAWGFGPLIAHGGNLPPNSASSPGAGYVGPSVEVRRERGMGGFGYAGMGSAVPQTPGPVIGFGTPGPEPRTRQGGGGTGSERPFDDDGSRGENPSQEGSGGSESIVVSVGLLPQQRFHHPNTSFESSSPTTPAAPRLRLKTENSGQNGLIYPLSTFILDIFVFNRSTWTRRFEVSCPDSRSRRKRREVESFANRGPGKRHLDRGKGFTPLPDPVCADEVPCGVAGGAFYRYTDAHGCRNWAFDELEIGDGCCST
ncbi:hypothetical protein BT96DRAFT_1013549 [Gymnopus androsaceus JB14]|uniref:Uncharacterized protein n=1 Tax=Gymnopus androsaceus JB14 TaxID=1447944 RepID=A0A6A4IG65_9AGAR|nr:hypothetical protein BT96DRAFT_1013549 [Gymnopus androsaceus JB14]